MNEKRFYRKRFVNNLREKNDEGILFSRSSARQVTSHKIPSIVASGRTDLKGGDDRRCVMLNDYRVFFVVDDNFDETIR